MQLFDFLQNSPTPFHATKTMKIALEAKGYLPLNEASAWNLKANEKYYVTRNDSSIIAFTYPGLNRCLEGYTMVGAHTDSPTLKIKPNPNLTKAGVQQLGVEVYGGALLNPWFDRDLSIAGRVSLQTKEGEVVHKIIDFKQPVAFIPSLAIHLDREANSNRTINAQKYLPLVVGLEKGKTLQEHIQTLLSTNDEVLAHELVVYDTQKPSYVGFDQKFICGARLDNLLSCYVGLEALGKSDTSKASLLVCNDHEEVGSRSSHGAQSNFLESVLQRISQSQENYFRMMKNSVLISTDNAHALHPNFTEVHEENHVPHLGKGVVIKHNADQSYATNSVTTAMFKKQALACEKNIQEYVVRSDTRCGSTIGPITASKLGIDTIDVGIPTWAMHSIRESACMDDVKDLEEILVLVYNRN